MTIIDVIKVVVIIIVEVVVVIRAVNAPRFVSWQTKRNR
jgi:hypothetical protein